MTTSLELSTRLFELKPEWDDTYWHFKNMDKGLIHFDVGTPHPTYIPAYSLGYLIRKLPLKYYVRRHNDRQGDWWAYKEHSIVQDKHGESILAVTPEDCVAKLCIQLIEERVL